MKLKIDILKMELEKKLPHWLSPEARNSHKLDEIRARRRKESLEKSANDDRRANVRDR